MNRDVLYTQCVRQSRRYIDMLEAASKYYKALESGAEVTELKETLDLLSEPFSDDPAFMAFLNMKRVAALGVDVTYAENQTD